MAAARRAAEGFPVPKVTAESLAAARAAAAAGSEGRGSLSPSAAASWRKEEGPGVPLACTDAAGGGAPAPSAPSSSAPPEAAATSPREGASPPSSYGEDGGASPLESLLSSSSSSSPSSPLPAAEIPKRSLAAAHAAVRLPGSATACVVSLDPASGTLHGVSVGDSGALVVRKNFLLFRSRNSSHSFDCPRQLAAAPEHVEWSDGVEDGEAFEVEGLEEGMSFFFFFFPETKKTQAHLFFLSLSLPRRIFSCVISTPGDVVLLGTDGVFDNCWAAELLALLPTETTTATKASDGAASDGDSAASSSSSPPSGPSALSLAARDIAEKIVRFAAANSRDETYPSPYAAEAAACGVDLRGGAGGGAEKGGGGASFGAAVSSFASRLFGGSDDEDAGGGAVLGGKLDDITVVVAVVGAV